METFEAQFLTQYRDLILPSHLKALYAMKECRTSLSHLMEVQCTECDHHLIMPHSCGHRSCPHCQHHESQQWLERQLKKQVPAEYFLLTFTLPKEFRELAWRHQRVLYSFMIRCAWETVKLFTQNDKKLKGTAGAIAVLHTHSRRLDYHPHVHLVVPAAAIDKKKKLWRTKNDGYLFNHKALAKVFRAKMLDAITDEELALPENYPKQWVVDCKSVGTGEKALIYLGRYLYRGVIREKDIVACEDGQVTFRYQDSKTKRMASRTVSGAEFLWLIFQHVLPKRFRRTRNFGFLHPNSKRLIGLIHYLLGFNPNRALAWIKERPRLLCPLCGAKMMVVATRIPPFLSPGQPTVPIPGVAAGALVM
uniref:Transposase zinc-binding domain-containing protein n=4 Tax=Candidatus Kentrum sp. SD TaxID=2126332 RepID=A0A450YYX6_9GAMM|nr:MAG: Transposase zinc-binding domain-containing protein [Candidatus Kentron sp. SD]